MTGDPILVTGHSRSRASVPRSAGEAAPAATTARSRSAAHRHYARRRNREIAYGRWQPWASAAPVRDHVRMLRASGLSYQAIARAAGVSPMTVRRLLRGQPPGQRDIPRRIRTAQASRLLAINDGTLRHAAVRRNAAGTRRRLQALIAMGHPAASLARRLDMAPRTLSDIVSGMTATVSPGHARGGPPPVRANVGPTPTGTHPARAQGSGRRPPTGRAVGLAYADGPR